jgi:hypothetical protein
MRTDPDEPLDAQRLLEAQSNERAFEQRRLADPNFARMPRWAPHRPWRATPYDRVMTVLGAIMLVGIIVIYVFF